jgi:hypothetical protein
VCVCVCVCKREGEALKLGPQYQWAGKIHDEFFSYIVGV